MHHETIEKIREKIRSSRMRTERKTELFRLLENLEEELNELPLEKSFEASEIALLTENLAKCDRREAEYRASLMRFEIHYPATVRLVNRICSMFSDLGI